MTFSVVSRKNGQSLPGLSHCLNDQIQKWAEFSLSGFFTDCCNSSLFHFPTYIISDLWCLHMDVLESSIIYLHDCVCVRRDLVILVLQEAGRAWSAMQDVMCLLPCTAPQNVVQLCKATRKGVCLCFALFLEDWRAKCCSQLTGKNIAFAYFLCNLWVLIKKWLLFQSIILV